MQEDNRGREDMKKLIEGFIGFIIGLVTGIITMIILAVIMSSGRFDHWDDWR